MVKQLEKRGLILRHPGQARSLQILIPDDEIPRWNHAKKANSTTNFGSKPKPVAPIPVAVPANLYVLAVFLSGGPVSEKFAKIVIRRDIEIRGDQTLDQLHEAIFEAYDRFDEHLYQFQFGKRPFDPEGPNYVGHDIPKGDDVERDARKAKLDDLDLIAHRVFGYRFDFGDEWFHQVQVERIEKAIPTVTYPRVIKRVGKSPPQYDKDETMSKSRTKGDSGSLIETLASAIGQAARSAKFLVTGQLPAIDPGLEVEGLGRVSVPLKRGAAKSLIAACQLAPYGKGTETLVSTRVRKTFELDPQKFVLSNTWSSAIDDATRTVATSLGLPVDRLEATLYKLLVYEKGGFFLPHRDSEKHDRMVASLIVVLPNPFEGGRLIVRHGAAAQKLGFQEAAAGKAPCFAAFYADCEHEVERVVNGVRIALAYNLVLKPQPGKPSGAKAPTTSADRLTEAIGSWVARQPDEPLVFALDHHYTQRGLSLDLLKGADRQLADQVVLAAANADCLVHLAQVTRHLVQFADDGSFDGGFSRYSNRAPKRQTIEIGETYEDELSGTEWTSADGIKQPWGEMAFELSAIVSSVPIDDWKPTSEEFEGYTGNAGNSLDRWYHRSAIVVWHRDHHYDVVASTGATASIPLFCSMVSKLAKTPKKRIEGARFECVRFARAIVTKWPTRFVGYGHARTVEDSLHDFPKHLLMLHDQDLIAVFLKKLAEQDGTLPLKSFILAACHEFGFKAFARELKQLIAPRPIQAGRDDLSMRDIEWLSAFCRDQSKDSEKATLADELCSVAVERFCKPTFRRPNYYSSGDHFEATVAEKSLPLLLQALAARSREVDVSRVISYARELPLEFSLDHGQIPALKLLIPWSRKQLGSVPLPFHSWLDAVREQLERATAKEPSPPSDWARPGEVECKCQYCAQLKAFLSDPTQKVGRIAAREDLRQHVISTITQHGCDVTQALERLRSPYSLVLTKTNGSYERAVKRYKKDLSLLNKLLSYS